MKTIDFLILWGNSFSLVVCAVVSADEFVHGRKEYAAVGAMICVFNIIVIALYLLLSHHGAYLG